jgi:hypothetical protein
MVQHYIIFQKIKNKKSMGGLPLPNMGWSHLQLQPPPQTKGAESTLLASHSPLPSITEQKIEIFAPSFKRFVSM